jgi:hypothetical protein
VKQLVTYLNDHLAGSVSAVELLDHLIQRHQDDPLGKLLHQVRADIVADQDVLKKIVHRFNAGESSFRKAAAWLAEKVARAKINLGRQKTRQLGLLEALEALVLGVTGKQLLWRSLNASIGDSPLLRGIDLTNLEERAIEQIERLELQRLEIAREVLLRMK